MILHPFIMTLELLMINTSLSFLTIMFTLFVIVDLDLYFTLILTKFLLVFVSFMLLSYQFILIFHLNHHIIIHFHFHFLLFKPLIAIIDFRYW